jgi:hypothetical protein
MKISLHPQKLFSPIILIFLVIISTCNNYAQSSQTQKISMIHPAGDVKHTGRKFPNGYERAVSFRIAEQLQKGIEY